MGTAPTITRQAANPAQKADRSVPAAPATWWHSPLALGLLGNLLMWAALPPLELAPLAWLAPVPWIVLIRQNTLTGKRPYAVLWLTSFVFWLAALYWLTLPHWATSFGWIALCIYLAFYFPVFVGLSRVAVHTLGISSLVAVPVVWTGLELFRAHLLTGFAMASLAHTQYRWPEMIQISDLFGAYGVSFLIVFVGACLGRMLPCDGRRWAWWPAVPAAAALGAALAYGQWQTSSDSTTPGPKVALIQGSIDIEMKHDPTQAYRIYDEYFGLSRKAVKEHPDLDLIVWPETMFRHPWVIFDEAFQPPADAQWTPAQVEADSRHAVEQTVRSLGTPCLLGIDTICEKVDRTERYNSAYFTDREGQVQGRYDKCHLVPFGEYVPLAETFPWLYALTPLPFSSMAGSGPQSVRMGEACYAVDICYENTLPHRIRSEVMTLRDENREPDILVNLTNDGWYWGSSELDMHLACAVFRAVECRKPYLIAANTGFSASIDSSGRILAQGGRRTTDVIVAETRIDHRGSWYLDHGDLLAGLCLAGTGSLLVIGLWRRRGERKKPAPASS